MAEAPRWGDDWPSVRALWGLRPDVAHLNHGAWGAAPIPALDRQTELRTELESDPVDFMLHTFDARLADARKPVGELLGANPDDLVFVPNATTGVQTVLSSLPWQRGDRVVHTDHVYAGIRNQLATLRQRHGIELAEVAVNIPDAALSEVADAVLAAVDAAPTTLLVIDAIASATAMRFPIEQIVAGARRRRVAVLVDGAHAPGQVEVNLTALGADWWVGNLHKWCCAPKGCAVLHVRRERQESLRPLVQSHGSNFRTAFDWTGTADMTAWLAAPAALGVLESLGWDRVRAYQHALSSYGAQVVATAVGTEPVLPDFAHASMALVDLGRDLSADEGLQLQRDLFHRHQIQVGLTWWRGRAWVRLSAQVYNEAAEYDRLAEVLPGTLG